MEDVPHQSAGPRYYILSASGEVEPCPTFDMWFIWFALTPFEQRKIAYDALPGGIEVSTVFMGIDIDGYGVPELWETRILLGGAGRMVRYRSRPDAASGHARIVQEIVGAQHSPLN